MKRDGFVCGQVTIGPTGLDPVPGRGIQVLNNRTGSLVAGASPTHVILQLDSFVGRSGLAVSPGWCGPSDLIQKEEDLMSINGQLPGPADPVGGAPPGLGQEHALPDDDDNPGLFSKGE